MIGIDIVKISRIERMIERFEDRGLKKFLSEAEINLVKNGSSASGFWAIKEAFSKAIGTGISKECSFFDVEIYKDVKNATKLAVSKRVIEKYNIKDVAISITHDGEYAIGVVVIESSTTNEVKQF